MAQAAAAVAELTGCPLRLVVDLTNTDRHYKEAEMKQVAQTYLKLQIRGREIPAQRQRDEFNCAISRATEQSDSCVLVHCTHGVNRTVSPLNVAADA